jgi:hypothetical protein
VYLGSDDGGAGQTEGAPLALVEDPDHTVLIHGRLADAEVRPGDPRRLVPIATASGTVDAIERAHASWRIDQSRKVIEFAHTKGASPLPDVQHAMRDLRLLSHALRRYAEVGDGATPARLADLYDFVEDPRLELSPAQRGAGVAVAAGGAAAPRAR